MSLKKKYVGNIVYCNIRKKNCRITDMIDYPGNKSTVIRFTFGFGADTINEEATVLTSDLEEFLEKRFSKFAEHIAVIKEENLPVQEKVKTATVQVPKEGDSVTPENLRVFLFGCLKEIKVGKLDINKAKAISGTAQVIVNAWKVEKDGSKV